MKPQAGQTYKREWQTLAQYLHATWPGVRRGTTVATAIWLLEHLRRIEEGGIIPAYDIEGQLVERVAGLGMKGEKSVQKPVATMNEQ